MTRHQRPARDCSSPGCEAIAAGATSTEKKATADKRRFEREAAAGNTQAAQLRAQTNH
jgi:hypothetical protein